MPDTKDNSASGAPADAKARDVDAKKAREDTAEENQKVADEASARAISEAEAVTGVPVDETLNRVIEKIGDADSILVALSKDPSVDEMTAALAMTLSLDRMGKHATAIYSGKTPNALQFLEPEKTFESNTNSLQDFIIALDKEKADHLRYKIEGDFVKVYITPYKTTISEKDLEFTHGEVNVDMVISFNVAAPEDLDAALAQHGRIMHDAVSINISNGAPGRIGGLEWYDANMSSVSEMVLRYLNATGAEIEKDVATALLTGIVAETERFSNPKTTPETMAAGSELMQKGADQQLVVAHLDELKESTEPETPAEPVREEPKNSEPGSIDVSHEEEAPVSVVSGEVAPESAPSAETLSPEEQLQGIIAGMQPTPLADSNSDVAASEVIASAVPEAPTAPEVPAATEITTTPGMSGVPEVPKVEAPAVETQSPETPIMQTPAIPTVQPPETPTGEVAAVQTTEVPVDQLYKTEADTVKMNDGVMAPMEELEQPKDYGAMMEEALAEPDTPMMPVVPEAPTTPEVPAVPITPLPAEQQNVADMVNQMTSAAQPMPEMQPVAAVPEAQPAPVVMPEVATNPAMPMVPEAPTAPEVQPIAPIAPAAPDAVQAPVAAPEIQTMTPEMQAVAPEMQTVAPEMPSINPASAAAPEMPQIAPPPPPPIDTSDALGIPEAPAGVTPPPEPVNPVVVQPVQDPTSVPPVQDPGSFKIPGM